MNIIENLKNTKQPTKVCKECKIKKPADKFRLYGPGKKYLYPSCKECAGKEVASYRRASIKEALIPNLDGEIWEPVLGYEGLYQVSNLGRVKKVYLSTPNKQYPDIRIKEKLMGERIDKYGYSRVTLTKGGIGKVSTVHLLVWDAFGDVKRDGFILVVDHKDNNKRNNALSNLQCVTQRLNSSKDRERKHSEYLGVYKHSDKPKKWQSKIMSKGKSKHLGLFYTELEASQAYQKALSEIQE